MDGEENKQWFFSKDVFDEVKNAAMRFTKDSGGDMKVPVVVLTDDNKTEGARWGSQTLKGTDKVVMVSLIYGLGAGSKDPLIFSQ